MANEYPLITVAVICYNQLDEIRWMLRAWECQTALFDDFEMVISDDGSEERIVKAIRKGLGTVSYRTKLITHQDDGFHAARARNDAIRAAKGKYILFMDGDTFPGKHTLTDFIPHLDENTALHAKRWRLDPVALKAPFSWNTLEKHKIRGEWRAEKLMNIPPAPYTHFSGANCIFPTKIMKDFLWAPDDWNGFGFDDYYVAARWVASGRIIKYVDSVAWHLEHPNTEGDKKTGQRFVELERQLRPILSKIYGKYKAQD